MKPKGRQQGFSLLELLIVVAIILIVASIAIPRFLQARAAASQANAAATMKSISTALVMYQTNWNTFPAAITALGGICPPAPIVTAACTLDDTISKDVAAGTFNNYVWVYSQTGTGSGFTLTAAPAPGNQAIRSYFLDQNGTTKYSDSGAATATSAALGN